MEAHSSSECHDECTSRERAKLDGHIEVDGEEDLSKSPLLVSRALKNGLEVFSMATQNDFQTSQHNQIFELVTQPTASQDKANGYEALSTEALVALAESSSKPSKLAASPHLKEPINLLETQDQISSEEQQDEHQEEAPHQQQDEPQVAPEKSSSASSIKLETPRSSDKSEVEQHVRTVQNVAVLSSPITLQTKLRDLLQPSLSKERTLELQEMIMKFHQSTLQNHIDRAAVLIEHHRQATKTLAQVSRNKAWSKAITIEPEKQAPKKAKSSSPKKSVTVAVSTASLLTHPPQTENEMKTLLEEAARATTKCCDFISPILESSRELQTYFLDQGGSKLLADWLEDFQKNEMQASTAKVMQALIQLPIELRHLKTSQMGKVVRKIKGSSAEVMSKRELLIERWTKFVKKVETPAVAKNSDSDAMAASAAGKRKEPESQATSSTVSKQATTMAPTAAISVSKEKPAFASVIPKSASVPKPSTPTTPTTSTSNSNSGVITHIPKGSFDALFKPVVPPPPPPPISSTVAVKRTSSNAPAPLPTILNPQSGKSHHYIGKVASLPIERGSEPPPSSSSSSSSSNKKRVSWAPQSELVSVRYIEENTQPEYDPLSQFDHNSQFDQYERARHQPLAPTEQYMLQRIASLTTGTHYYLPPEVDNLIPQPTVDSEAAKIEKMRCQEVLGVHYLTLGEIPNAPTLLSNSNEISEYVHHAQIPNFRDGDAASLSLPPQYSPHGFDSKEIKKRKQPEQPFTAPIRSIEQEVDAILQSIAPLPSQPVSPPFAVYNNSSHPPFVSGNNSSLQRKPPPPPAEMSRKIEYPIPLRDTSSYRAPRDRYEPPRRPPITSSSSSRDSFRSDSSRPAYEPSSIKRRTPPPVDNFLSSSAGSSSRFSERGRDTWSQHPHSSSDMSVSSIISGSSSGSTLQFSRESRFSDGNSRGAYDPWAISSHHFDTPPAPPLLQPELPPPNSRSRSPYDSRFHPPAPPSRSFWERN